MSWSSSTAWSADDSTAAAPASPAAAPSAEQESPWLEASVEAPQQGPGLLPARPVTKKELLQFTDQLALLTDTGVSLAQAMQTIAEQESHPRLRRVLAQLLEKLEQGEDFSQALEQFPKLFGPTYITLVRAGEATGLMSQMLARVADYLRAELDTRRKIRAAMAYPCVMALMAVGVTVFLLTYVMPKFTPLFASRGMNLPLPTRVVLAISNALTGYWWAWLLALAAGGVGLGWVLRTEAGRWHWDGLKLRLPVLGPLVQRVILSRSLRTLGVLLNCGVPLLEALKLTSQVSGNRRYQAAWDEVIEEVTTGKEIHTVLQQGALFPPMLVRMIATGEETGRLDEVLDRVSLHYDREIEAALKTATSLIEPLMIGVMGVVVGGIGLALMLPIFKLSSPG